VLISVLRDLLEKSFVRGAFSMTDIFAIQQYTQRPEIRMFISECFRTECKVFKWTSFGCGLVEDIAKLAKGSTISFPGTPLRHGTHIKTIS